MGESVVASSAAKLTPVDRRIRLLNERLIGCRRCPRLVEWRQAAALSPPARYRAEPYWARPVPGFGDERGPVLIVGLAPAAHGANRTGRMFTGDRSGDWLFSALAEVGLANQPESTDVGDGLTLEGAYVTASVRCAPPQNRPTADERDNCRPWLEEEFDLIDPKVVLCLGGFAFDQTLRLLGERGAPLPRPRPRFGHGIELELGEPWPVVVASYHPSQQNTFTGRLTRQMTVEVLRQTMRHR